MHKSSLETVLNTASEAIDDRKESLNELSQTIWNLKELRFEEFESHKTLCDFLEKQGFHVQRKIGMETAFHAAWDNLGDQASENTSPHIGVICEYDALPNIGHACGHNLIAEIGVAAAIGIKEAIEKHPDIRGKVSVIGTPAEEGGGGKIDLMELGVFDKIDIALMAHPAPFSDSRPIFLSTKRFKVNYQGKESHACGFPWEGVNALDAAVQAYTSIGTLRQQLKPEWRVSAIITKGGVMPNIIPCESELMVQLRTAKDSELAVLEEKVKRCFQAAALATGCEVTFTDVLKPYKCLVTNNTLATLYESSLESLGVQVESPKSKTILGSTDMGNVSHMIPSLHPTYNCNTSAFNHTVEFTAAAGSSDAQPSTLIQGKALAMAALQVLYQPSLLDKIKQDFHADLQNA